MMIISPQCFDLGDGRKPVDEFEPVDGCRPADGFGLLNGTGSPDGSLFTDASRSPDGAGFPDDAGSLDDLSVDGLCQGQLLLLRRSCLVRTIDQSTEAD